VLTVPARAPGDGAFDAYPETEAAQACLPGAAVHAEVAIA
jgi:hypothetical protein